MKLISRITMRFDPGEDRIRLTLVDRDGDSFTLWLTWRTANVLVDGFLAVIDQAAVPAAKAAPRPVAARVEAGVAEQFWAQTDAEMGLTSSAAEPAPPEPRIDALVRRAALRRNTKNGRYFLELHWSDDFAVLPLDALYIRQILKLLHRAYSAAEWSPKGLWPVWLGDDAHRAVLSDNEIN